jgi:hypothetical protein
VTIQDPLGVMKFTGGETAAMARLKDYFWDKVSIHQYFNAVCNYFRLVGFWRSCWFYGPLSSQSSHQCRTDEQDKVRVYKDTRNGMLGADYSTKFSPWLAHGCITPRIINDEVSFVGLFVEIFTVECLVIYINQMSYIYMMIIRTLNIHVAILLFMQLKRYESERVANQSTYW